MSIKPKRNVLYDPSLCYPEETNVYESKSFTVGAGITDYDVKTSQGMFGTVSKARYVEIKTDTNITVKFNADTNANISISATEGKLVIDPTRERLAVSNIFITNATAGTANISVILT